MLDIKLSDHSVERCDSCQRFAARKVRGTDSRIACRHLCNRCADAFFVEHAIAHLRGWRFDGRRQFNLRSA